MVFALMGSIIFYLQNAWDSTGYQHGP